MFKNLSNLKNKKAFTIAEMTVVLLILSIVMAAILPVATNKKTGGSGAGGNGSLWKLARNNTDIWFASPSTNQSVLIGTSITPDNSGYGRLYINIPESTSRSQIAMMYNNLTVGYIKFKKDNNIGLGPNPMSSAITGSDNTSIGQNALISLTSGYNNIGLGSGALRSNTTGYYNTALGYNALGKNTAGYNVGMGRSALYNNSTGGFNVGIGDLALYTNETGSNNVGVGRRALSKTKETNDNTGVGYESLYNNTGSGNIGLGAYAGKTNTSGNYNLYIGYGAGSNGTKTGNNNIGIGNYALYGPNSAASASNNTAIGNNALYTVSTGGGNTAAGHKALYLASSGYNNTAVGFNALNAVSSGAYNSGFGNNACAAVTTGLYKSCLGHNSGNASLPTGFSATSTTVETIIGNSLGNIYLHAPNIYAGAGNDATTASQLKVTGNILANAQIKTNTYLESGTYAKIGTYATVGDYLTVTNHAYTNYLYANHIRNKDSVGSYNTTIYGTFYGPWTPSSDKRLKNIEGFANIGLKEVKKLDVYKYTYKGDPKTQKIGLIAQDVQKVIPFAILENTDGYLAISQENIIYTMFNAIKDLDKLYESLKTKFQDYIVRLNLVEDRINALLEVNRDLSKRIDELEKRVNKLEKEYTKLEKKQCKCK